MRKRKEKTGQAPESVSDEAFFAFHGEIDSLGVVMRVVRGFEDGCWRNIPTDPRRGLNIGRVWYGQSGGGLRLCDSCFCLGRVCFFDTAFCLGT